MLSSVTPAARQMGGDHCLESVRARVCFQSRGFPRSKGSEDEKQMLNVLMLYICRGGDGGPAAASGPWPQSRQ